MFDVQIEDDYHSLFYVLHIYRYDGQAKRLDVYVANRSDARPAMPVMSERINLRDHVQQTSYFGFSASTGNPGIEYNCVLEWELQIEAFPAKKAVAKWVKIGVGIGVGAAVLAALLAAKYYSGLVGYLRKRRRALHEDDNVIGALKRLPGMPREFRLKELKRATENFSEGMVLGRGGFGVVYRGVLREKEEVGISVVANNSNSNGNSNSNSNTSNNNNNVCGSTNEVAVKKFSRDNIKGRDDFLAELTIIHRLRHKHLVRLVGKITFYFPYPFN